MYTAREYEKTSYDYNSDLVVTTLNHPIIISHYDSKKRLHIVINDNDSVLFFTNNSHGKYFELEYFIDIPPIKNRTLLMMMITNIVTTFFNAE